jgi:hypothetical protein
MAIGTSRGAEGPGPTTLRQPTERHGGNARNDEEVIIMTSKAIASLDEWLARAEEVLLEQALSPSSSGAWEGVKHEWTVSLGSFELGLGALLDRLCCRPGRWVLIAEDARRSYRFWQALAFEDGSLVVEAASGIGCPDSERLSPEAEDLLVELGWDAPDPPSSPNWRRIEATTSPHISGVAAQALRTLHEVFELADKDRVQLALFASPRRGGTPASECLPGDDASLEEAAPRNGFRPTTEEWADYYRQLFPCHANPRNSFEFWKYATTAAAAAAAEGFWAARQYARREWESAFGGDRQGWPCSHPPAVLRHEGIARAACLGCTWIAGGEDEGELQTAARRHSSDRGDAEETNRELPSPPGLGPNEAVHDPRTEG